ncbi:hypothetical protein Dsin_014671 [Dipteronia sinensis]|uniref:tripeptidyl-peptidase II n=1 Tax=Dipteronia sinensis TaxID=43782 RepID=A0AAE0EA46_9ROSI|nr:hypothetical protein Dsin_014671 [Dipteronia sinensis]
MPKEEIAADRFIKSHPEFDGRGVIIAIFDSGVDPAAAGLQVTSDGKTKILDVIDCTGSGDIDTKTVVKADSDGCIRGASGAILVVNSSWKNPSGDWHVGYKMVYELFTDTLISRLKKERKKKWDEKNHKAITKAVLQLNEFDQKQKMTDNANLKRVREDLQNRVDFLRKQADCYDDKGPIIDAVVWHDGENWRVALDTQSLEHEPDRGKLADFVPLTNYRTEQKYGVFSQLNACTFVVNVYDRGNILSLVTDCSPHGTHVAGIATACHLEDSSLNGVAPGAQLISCKIGDARLGSMETGTGLTRALIAAVEHKCDLINMSYGEPTSLPDYGRFVDLVHEVVNKHGLIYVSSAGNSGPALNTVVAPGGTSSSIIGVGAYVYPAMAAGAHSVVEPPCEGLEYTWSSRGPTADGDLGVCISAPGGAVVPVSKWTLQKRMLLNGTSMASPSACGGFALVISAMKANGIPVSPFFVRKAVENTSVPVGGFPEDKLSTGQGLMQVDKAYEYVQKFQNFPCAWYEIKITQSGKSTPTYRGIYLREASDCRHSRKWTVQVEPKLNEGASNLEELSRFKECIELHSTDKAVVMAPDYLNLSHNIRSFNIVVDPTNLKDGLHYYEIYGVDCEAPERGPLFRIPVTIIKPMAVLTRPPIVSFAKMLFLFIEVPPGASWVEATMRTSGFDTSRRFFVDTVQICPLRRPCKWESVVTFSSPAAKCFTIPVVGGQTMELAIAQFWSSGMGSQETTIVDFEIVFHGIDINKDEVLLDGDAPVRIDATALLASERLAPAAILNKIRVPYQPIESKLSVLPSNRDKLPSGKQILALTLTYKFKLEDGAEVKPHIPLLNNRIYDTKFESQFYMISDTNKRVYAMGDAYPNSSKLPKGEYTLQLYLRHDDMEYLEKIKQLVLFIERNLEEKDVIRLNFFSQPDGHVTGNGAYKSSILVPGKMEAFYLSPPIKDKLPKYPSQGSTLLGVISYGKLSFAGQEEGKNPRKNPVSHQIAYSVPPYKVGEDKGKDSPACTKTVSESYEEEVRDLKIKILGSLKQDTDEECSEWKKLAACLKSEYPKYTPLLAKILEGLLSQGSVGDKVRHNGKVIEKANEIIDSVDQDELVKFFSPKNDLEDEEVVKMKKKMETTCDQLMEAFYQKGLALAEIESLMQGDKTSALATTLFKDNLKELRRWAGTKSSKYRTLLLIQERRCGRLGTALKVLNDMIQDNTEPSKKKLYEQKISLLDEIGWSHLATHERVWIHVRFPTSLPLF